MQFTTLLLTTLASVSAVAAREPKPIRRSCQLLPQSDPNFAIAKDLSQGLDVTEVQKFQIGRVAAGPCSLIAKFEPGFPGIDQNGETLIDVVGVDRNVTGSLVGSFRIDPVNGQKTTINSFACKHVLAFTFNISSDERPGDVAFTADKNNGIFLQVGDC